MPIRVPVGLIKLIIKKLFLNIILILLPVAAWPQEVLTGLQVNPIIKSGSENRRQQKGMAAPGVLELPFFDDFSGNSWFPSTERWSDDYVFINNDYTDQQITTGVATFDCIDNTGKLYDSASFEIFVADRLTSLPINLNYPASANIWLSFYYQPAGLGDAPEPKDSLTLEFYSPSEARWYSVWSAPGSGPTRFKPVLIKIDQLRYLQEGFRFRFANLASLQKLDDQAQVGNQDIWNLDYVYLNRNRTAADSSAGDVAFRKGLRSILKTHESMPWQEFQQVYLQEMGSFIPIHYRNNDTIVRNVTRNFVIHDVYRNLDSYSFSAGATNIDPRTNVDYDANLIYTFNTTGNDSAKFRITCILKTDDFDPKQNDTIRYDQVFSNYFAFDDGTAEAGYGINGSGSRNAMVAYRFRTFMDDTIRAVQICFNSSYMNSNRRAFDLMIWGDSNDLPGDILYSVEGEIVEEGTMINGYYTYVLPEAVPVNGIFYIGWKQVSEAFLNAGFDINTPHNGKQLYWLNGEWHTSQMNGSVMMRPLVGRKLRTTGIDNTEPPEKKVFRLWPNPAISTVTLVCTSLISGPPDMVSVIDLNGNELIRVIYTEQIDVSSLKAGSYIVIPKRNNKPMGYLRLVKTR
jgi:hypothetical protein